LGCSPVDLLRSGFIRVTVKVTRMTGRFSSVEKYAMYLPKEYNDVWRELHERGVKVEVYVKLPEESSSKP